MTLTITDKLKNSRDMISQLREMEHYAKLNIEKLSGFWFQLEEELQQEEFAKRMDQLLSHETEIHQGLTSLVSDFEIECNRIENEET